MQVLYIDVYFLINFTTDLLALYAASHFLCVGVGRGRLLLSAGAGALLTSLLLLLPWSPVICGLLSVLGLLLTVLLATPGCSISRRLRFFLFFLVGQTLLGGGVHYGYTLLDRYIGPGLFDAIGAEDRRLLRLAVLLLFCIAVLRLLITVLSSAVHERQVMAELVWEEKHLRLSALVDSGNLLRDPMGGLPVILIKEAFAASVFPKQLLNTGNCDVQTLGRHIRLIPRRSAGKRDLLIGLRLEDIRITTKNKTVCVTAVVAIDREEGTYGGHGMLLPSVLLDHA